MECGIEYCVGDEKNYYGDTVGDANYSNNGFETTGVFDTSSHSLSQDLSPSNALRNENNLSEMSTNYAYVSMR